MESTKLIEALKEHFGFEKFRDNQEAIIQSVLENKDTLAIMPTGGGKSICYQLPAMILPGLTIVVSPLIALMKDQVDALKVNGIAAGFYNSSLNAKDTSLLRLEIENQRLKLLYIAPESLQYLDDLTRDNEITLIAIDEAHCISSWGPDFRPAYTRLGAFKQRYPQTPILALTATADKATREDIVLQLNLQTPNIYLSSFDRKNLNLEVRPGREKLKQIVQFIKDKPNESGIIYCLSRKETESLVERLDREGILCRAYHAGLGIEERNRTQEQFIRDEVQIICATVAFGMGIDKSNVRWVIHNNLPKNLEGYYQEIGRAGRDGLPSDTLLFYSFADIIQLQKFAEGASNEELQLAKLERMKQYAEAKSCRRRVLLSYFGELVLNDCGNCDICRNPPKFFDGTIIAQKALSAIARLSENEPIGVLVDFIRGAKTQTILEKGLQNLKTYGVGHDISVYEWNLLIIQLVNQGFCEIAFHQNNKIKLTALSKKVLFEGHKVELTHIEKAAPKKPDLKPQRATSSSENGSLFERLRTLRGTIATQEKVPAYVIFNDATLKNIEAAKPKNSVEFLAIDGVGQVKLEKYGDAFINEIKKYTS